ncbi:MAG: 3' terminal RNA ribose 2'-O-methyltransferase Hen1 [Planctomycetota bacterium]|jgi:3' terminal RNA ribose 2'-O-methyltransferase Hen1
MLLTITTTYEPATDLGYLLHKNPSRVQEFGLSFGRAHVFYPEATPERCTAALLLDVDPVGLIRGRRSPGRRGEGLIDQYVNDRPYASCSFLSTAIAKVFGSALGGRCEARPELVETPIPLVARISALPCRGGAKLLRELFEPLGYEIEAERQPLDPTFPDWGESAYHNVVLTQTVRLTDLLSHLYVLVPVLDDQKHYWVSEDEIEKLLRHGEGWLGDHPLREAITTRYLKHQRQLVKAALAQLVQEEDPALEAVDGTEKAQEEELEKPLSLNEQRMAAVVEELTGRGAKRVVDLGCGEGKLMRALLKDKSVERVVGMDVSPRALEVAARRLKFERMPDRQRARVDLIVGSLLYCDERLSGYDAAALVEVIEHLDPPRLAALERVVFEGAAPPTVVVTTPNSEYNVRWETLPAGEFRHKDHRFEWTRAEFRDWAERLGERMDYNVALKGIGPEDPDVGTPTQMAVFTRG